MIGLGTLVGLALFQGSMRRQNGDDSPSSRSPVQDAAAATEKPAVASAFLPGKELIDPGRQPTRRIAFVSGEGTTQVVDVAIEANSKTWEGSLHLPRVRLRAIVSILDASGKDVHYKIRVQSARLADEKPLDRDGEYLASKLGAVSGIVVRFSVGADGDVSVNGTTLPAEKSDPVVTYVAYELGRAMLHMFVAIPDAPIGSGARWRVRTVVDEHGIRAYSDSQLSALSVSATEAVVERVTSLSAAEPNRTTAENGQAIEISRIEGAMKTHLVLRPGQIVPTATGEYAFSMTLRAKGKAFERQESSTVSIRPSN